jgi:radical SAM superfamily enzyme YgiQ (UPF0313 family)
MYLKGFLTQYNHECFQCDLGLEVVLSIFEKSSLEKLFLEAEENEVELSDRAYRVFQFRRQYIKTIDAVISFLQNKDLTLANTICADGFLPRGDRFDALEQYDFVFGNLGLHDKARHMATLYLEDLGDFITDAIDEHFGFSRYAERIARTATHFDPIVEALSTYSYVQEVLADIVSQKIISFQPELVIITAPFPGNVLGAFTCAQEIKRIDKRVPIAFGGGYVNTELRSVYDDRVFDYMDFITLDDGEAPLLHLIDYIEGRRTQSMLKRTFLRGSRGVEYCNGSTDLDIPQSEVGTPDYSDLWLDRYISVIEIANPMHKLWSDGRWNKLTLAHGCYWGKCSFCDVTLDYIKRYEPINASILCDRIETIIAQTGQRGFHFVDEAAPPALMRDLAIEILRRGLVVSWWTNIRFEKSFTADLCKLLRASGCIAVSGGLEVASDRLLEKMKKGVTVAQVARVAQAFTEAHIMVHAYLMYGFPTQTDQETIDSLEMVRQMFEEGIIQSGFWHQFAMTAHSPVGMEPAAYGVEQDGPHFGGFAENDFYHLDETGAIHDLYSEGLKASLYNYMHGSGFEVPLREWFDHKTPKTKVHPHYIDQALSDQEEKSFKDSDIVLWLGGDIVEITIDDERPDHAIISIIGMSETSEILCSEKEAIWLHNWLAVCTPSIAHSVKNIKEMKSHYTLATNSTWDYFIACDFWDEIRVLGLVIL